MGIDPLRPQDLANGVYWPERKLFIVLLKLCGVSSFDQKMRYHQIKP